MRQRWIVISLGRDVPMPRPRLSVTGLLPGPRFITLTATDSYGITATDTVAIYIGYRTYLPLVLK